MAVVVVEVMMLVVVVVVGKLWQRKRKGEINGGCSGGKNSGQNRLMAPAKEKERKREKGSNGKTRVESDAAVAKRVELLKS